MQNDVASYADVNMLPCCSVRRAYSLRYDILLAQAIKNSDRVTKWKERHASRLKSLGKFVFINTQE